MSNLYDSYMNCENVIINSDDHVTVVFDVDRFRDIKGKLIKIYRDDKFAYIDLSVDIESSAVYYFGIKPDKIIINNDRKNICITAEQLLIKSVQVDRKLYRYIITVEVFNEKYIRD